MRSFNTVVIMAEHVAIHDNNSKHRVLFEHEQLRELIAKLTAVADQLGV